MKHLLSILFFLSSVSLAAQLPVQADIDLYHLQLSKNRFATEDSVFRHLLQTASREKLMMEFIERSFHVTKDGFNLFDLFNSYYIEPEERKVTIAKCYEVARKTGNQQLKYVAKYNEWDIDKFDKIDKSSDSSDELEDMLHHCQKVGDKHLEAYILYNVWHHCFHTMHYARSIAYGAKLIECLDSIEDNYPNEAIGYIAMGMTYYKFKDYDRAIPLLKKGLSYTHINNGLSFKALDHLAVYYHTKGDLDSAAYYQRCILSDELSQQFHPSVLHIAVCDLGKIYKDKGDIDSAIALLCAGEANMEKDWAIWDFIYGVYNSLGECMLAKNDLTAVKHYIAKVKDEIYDFPDLPKMDRLKATYALESKYYSRLGKQDLAALYMDSSLWATEKYEQLSGQHIILLGEQQLLEADIKLRNQKISNQRNTILFSVTALMLALVALLIIIYFYRKRNAAYKLLAQKAKEWALTEKTPEILDTGTEAANTSEKDPITTEDRRIMTLLEQEMTVRHIYRNTELTAEILADHLNIHRNVLSHAVNRITDGNFKNYINGYRIKEAVRIISETNRKELYIDELYEQVGFGNRTSFYRSFKQFTGLSPIEFQKNKGSSLPESKF